MLWRPKTAALTKFRAMLAGRPAEFPALVQKLEQETGLTFRGESFKRRLRCPDPQVEPYYSLRGMLLDTDRAPDELLFSPALADTVIETLRKLCPLYEYCLKFTV